jgi:radical SAM protein with 4Fe4S-binding SPASM domain
MGRLTPPLPEEIQVEVSGACNLRCRMCLVRYAPAIGRREGALDLEQYMSLVDGLPRLRRLTLQGLGEPLLSPHIVQMVEHAAGRGIEVGFNTNGTLMTREMADRLVAAGTAWIHVSLDGARAATYEEIRQGTTLRAQPGQFARVVGNLRGLVAARGDSSRPRIQLVFVAMQRNVAELPELVEMGAGIGVDSVWVQNLSHDFGDVDGSAAYREIRDYARAEALFDADLPAAEHAFAAARERAGDLGIELRLPRLSEPPPVAGGDGPGCSWPWTSAYVTHRGAVQPCCMVMGQDRATLGTLDDGGFADVWHGDAYRDFRERLLGDDPPEVCRGCSLYRRVF